MPHLGSCCSERQGWWTQSWQGSDEEGPSGWKESPQRFAPRVIFLETPFELFGSFSFNLKQRLCKLYSINRPKKPPADSEEVKNRNERNRRKKEKKKRRRLTSPYYKLLYQKSASISSLSLSLSTCFKASQILHGRAELKSWVELWVELWEQHSWEKTDLRSVTSFLLGFFQVYCANWLVIAQ